MSYAAHIVWLCELLCKSGYVASGHTFVDEYFLIFRRNTILRCRVSSLRSRTDQFIQIADLSLQSLSLSSTTNDWENDPRKRAIWDMNDHDRSSIHLWILDFSTFPIEGFLVLGHLHFQHQRTVRECEQSPLLSEAHPVGPANRGVLAQMYNSHATASVFLLILIRTTIRPHVSYVGSSHVGFEITVHDFPDRSRLVNQQSIQRNSSVRSLPTAAPVRLLALPLLSMSSSCLYVGLTNPLESHFAITS